MSDTTKPPAINRMDPAWAEHEEDERYCAAETMREDAFLQGVAFALSNIGWHPDQQPLWYDDEWADLPICRAVAWDDSGNSSVGIHGSCGVGLIADQSGTLIELLVNRIKDLDAMLRERDRRDREERP